MKLPLFGALPKQDQAWLPGACGSGKSHAALFLKDTKKMLKSWKHELEELF